MWLRRGIATRQHSKYRGKFGDAEGTAMQKAVEGQRGYGEAIDYRGQAVIAAWSYLPSFRWGMVVKQDDGEAFALIYRQNLVVGLLLAANFPYRDRRCALAGTDHHEADS